MASETNCHNMVSNLPLLFAGGYPTSLEKITESQLEKFIPFMVQCSLGNIQIRNNTEYSEPEWWPENVPFSIPLERPVNETDWHDKLKTIVIICYKFHASIFLLRFCQQLATYQPESLRYINNYNNTTSLFERSSCKLLVTFRNENMMYDQEPVNKSNKITLLSSRKMNSQRKTIAETFDASETVFEIYLCDNCEAELYSKDAYDEHQKTCQEDDDVIFCGEEFITNPIDKQLIEQTSFLQNLSLVNPKLPVPNQSKTPIKKNNMEQSTSGTNRRKPRCSQIVLSSNIPFSSPAGQQLIKLSKSCLTEGYIVEKIERYERYCSAPPLSDDSSKHSWPIKPIKYTRTPVTFRRPQDQTHRWYKFPRRQLNNRSRYLQDFLNLNINELKICKPVTVKLKRLTSNDIEAIHSANRHKTMIKMGHVQKSTFDEKSNIVDIIDLCSDDEDTHFTVMDTEPQHDIGNVSQTASTPTWKMNPFIEPLETPFELFTDTSSAMSLFNADVNYEYQNQENHRSFLNGAQGSIMTKIDELTEISMQRLSSTNQAHISVDLTL